MPWHPLGTIAPDGAVLIFACWADEPNRRLQAWRDPNGNVRLVTVETVASPEGARVTLSGARARDLVAAITDAEQRAQQLACTYPIT